MLQLLKQTPLRSGLDATQTSAQSHYAPESTGMLSNYFEQILRRRPMRAFSEGAYSQNFDRWYFVGPASPGVVVGRAWAGKG
jgi:hypothetical protein